MSFLRRALFVFRTHLVWNDIRPLCLSYHIFYSISCDEVVLGYISLLLYQAYVRTVSDRTLLSCVYKIWHWPDMAHVQIRSCIMRQSHRPGLVPICPRCPRIWCRGKSGGIGVCRGPGITPIYPGLTTTNPDVTTTLVRLHYGFITVELRFTPAVPRLPPAVLRQRHDDPDNPGPPPPPPPVALRHC